MTTQHDHDHLDALGVFADIQRRGAHLPRASFYQRDVSWHADARCAEIDTDLWFPDKGESTKEAKGVCAACPVRAECLEYALDINERFGVWGGTSERERRRLNKQWGNVA